MTIKESKLTIFETLEKLDGDIKLFRLADGSQLDLMLIFSHGQVTLIADDADSETIARYSIAFFKARWDAAFDLFESANLSMADLGNASTKVTESKRMFRSSRNELEQISAYNDTDFADKENRDYKDENNVSATETVTDENKNIKNFNASWEYLQKNYINDIVFRDILHLIGKSIYC